MHLSARGVKLTRHNRPRYRDHKRAIFSHRPQKIWSRRPFTTSEATEVAACAKIKFSPGRLNIATAGNRCTSGVLTKAQRKFFKRQDTALLRTTAPVLQLKEQLLARCVRPFPDR